MKYELINLLNIPLPTTTANYALWRARWLTHRNYRINTSNGFVIDFLSLSFFARVRITSRRNARFVMRIHTPRDRNGRDTAPRAQFSLCRRRVELACKKNKKKSQNGGGGVHVPYVTQQNKNRRRANMQNEGHIFVRGNTRGNVAVHVAVPRGLFYAFVFLCTYLSSYACTRTCAYTSSTCTHYRLRGRYGFYERRCAASEGGRSDAFDTIYKRRER